MNNFAVKSTKRGKNLWSVYGEKAITQIKDRRYAEYLKMKEERIFCCMA